METTKPKRNLSNSHKMMMKMKLIQIPSEIRDIVTIVLVRWEMFKLRDRFKKNQKKENRKRQTNLIKKKKRSKIHIKCSVCQKSNVCFFTPKVCLQRCLVVQATTIGLCVEFRLREKKTIYLDVSLSISISSHLMIFV